MISNYLHSLGFGILAFVTPVNTAMTKKFIRIGIIDSGLPPNYKQFPICAAQDFTNTGIVDDVGHGTNIANLATEGLNKNNYCLIVAKVFSSKEVGTSTDKIVSALMFLRDNKVNIVNLSLGGLDGYNEMEKMALQILLNEPRTVIIAAAGNNGKNLDQGCNYFPACYDPRILVVGNGFSNEKRAITSNYGNYVKAWENGENQCGGGICMSGTSQATAKATNKVARRYLQSDMDDHNTVQYHEAAWRFGEALIKYNKIDDNIKNYTDTYTQPLNKKLEVYLKRVPANYQQVGVIVYTGYEIILRQKVEINYGF